MAVKDDIVLLNHLELGAFSVPGHEVMPALLTGVSYRTIRGNQDATSLDQRIADEIEKTTKLPFRTLNLTVQPHEDRGFVWRRGQRLSTETDPYRLFDRLFAGAGMTAQALEQQRRRRKSLLDFVGPELERFAQRLSSEDRERVQVHAHAVSEVQRRLAEVPAVAGRPESLPASRFDVSGARNFDKVTRAMLDMIVLALASDLTRVVTLQLSDGVSSELIMPWLGPAFASEERGDLGYKMSHHKLAHDNHPGFVDMQRWFCEQFAYFIAKLKETRDAQGGSLLDQTVVWVVNNMSTGAGHESDNLPSILAGRAGGALRTGRYLRLKDGTTNNALLVTLAQMMDVPLESIGDTKQASIGELRGA